MDAFTVTTAMLEPLQTAISSGLTTIVPIGLGFFGTLIGIKLIPKIFYQFF